MLGAWWSATAFWIDKKAKIFGRDADKSDLSTVESVLADAARYSKPPLVVFVLYNLPNRGCILGAHRGGEICCQYLSNGECSMEIGHGCELGLGEYKTDVVDAFVNLLHQAIALLF